MFRLIALTIFVLAAGASFTIRGRAERAGEKMSWSEEGTPIMVGLRLCGGATWLSIVAAIAYPPAMAWGTFAAPDALRWFGVGCAVFATPMLVWTLRTIGKNITQTVGIRQGHELVTGGPYALVRHPLYTFGTLFMYGMALTLASWFTLATATGGLVFLIARLPNEERHLVEAFGPAYTEYMKRTGGLLPRLSR